MFQEEEEAAEAQIPTDIYEEILHRLPSGDLQLFKLVCKKWWRLISSPTFIQKHLERSKAECSNDDSRLVVSKDYVSTIIDCKNGITTITKLPFGSATFLGSCNDGLALYYCDAQDVMLALNPSTRKFEVRKPNTKIHYVLTHKNLLFTWFGRHPRTGEYVLVAARFLKIRTKERVVMINVHSLSRDTLLSSSVSGVMGRHSLDYQCYQTVGVLLHGRLHYLIHSGEAAMILVYNLETNEIELMPCPLKYGVHTLGVVEGCLCAFPGWEVWVMKEYGVKESWTLYNEDFDGNKVDSGILGFVPIAVCPNNDLILVRGGFRILAKYSLRDKEIMVLMADKTLSGSGIQRVTVTSCIDSLVSPASVWEK